MLMDQNFVVIEAMPSDIFGSYSNDLDDCFMNIMLSFTMKRLSIRARLVVEGKLHMFLYLISIWMLGVTALECFWSFSQKEKLQKKLLFLSPFMTMWISKNNVLYKYLGELLYLSKSQRSNDSIRVSKKFFVHFHCPISLLKNEHLMLSSPILLQL